MKIRLSILGLHLVAIVAFSLTQGCITSNSSGTGIAGAHHKGPFRHEVKSRSAQSTASTPITTYEADNGDLSDDTIDDIVIVENGGSSPEPYVAPVAPVAPVATTEIYIVQKGDILSRLAVKFNTTTKTLLSMNNLSNPDVLYVGQELHVPAGSTTSGGASSAPKHTSSVVTKGAAYEVQKGDTLSGIAVAAGVSINDLRSLNNIQDDKIFAGKTIYIPRGGKVPPKRTHTTRTPTPARSQSVDDTQTLDALAPPALVPPVNTTGSNSPDAVMIDHVIYPGDTLDSIAKKYGVSKSEIMRLNNITDESQIKENQRLRIPIAE